MRSASTPRRSPARCKASKFLTSRQVRERLIREARKNLAIRVEETDSPDTFIVLGRGELQLAILVETMRREGYEMQLCNPEVVTRLVDGASRSRSSWSWSTYPSSSSASSPSGSASGAAG